MFFLIKSVKYVTKTGARRNEATKPTVSRNFKYEWNVLPREKWDVFYSIEDKLTDKSFVGVFRATLTAAYFQQNLAKKLDQEEYEFKLTNLQRCKYIGKVILQRK
jgi:hypothetical protein